MTGAQQPRIRVVPDGDEHPRWAEVVELLERLDIHLDPWQIDILHASLLRRDDLWAAFTVAVCCPRQNGKNEILQARELVGALILGEQLIIHSAHLADTCMESFMKLDDLIDTNDWLLDQVDYVRRTNGRELIKFRNGSRIRFRTRTRGGGRGFSGSPVMFDEPMFFPIISQNAILPVLSAQPDPQAWYTGSAVDQLEHEDGVAFARVRERALAGEDPRLAYFEWSLEADSPLEVTDDQALDVEAWARTNPALGIRITPEYIRAEREELLPRGFAVERLGVGDWPDTSGAEERAIDLRDWDALVDPESVLQPMYVLAFDVSPERQTSIALAGLNQSARFHVQIPESRPGTGWAPTRIAEMVDTGEVERVICDAVGPAASLVVALNELGVEVETMNSQEHGQACGRLVDMVNDGTLAHLGSDELRDAIRGARTRPLGDTWLWSRKHSGVNISPLVAATLALGGAVSSNTLTSVGIF